MLKRLYFLWVCFFVFSLSALAQTGSGSLSGKLTDRETGEPLPFVNVIVQRGETQVAGGSTDFDGEYTIKPLAPGSYDVVVSYVGYNSVKKTGVIINANKITFNDIQLEPGVALDEFELIEYTVPLIDKDGGASGGTVTRDDITRMPGRSATSIAATVGGVQTNDDGDVSIRGARTENTYYYIDGVKVRGSTNLPKAAIEEVSVITGGIPANYGDATGGIISITTRGATSQYFGGIDILTSGFKNEDGDGIGLDPYSQTQIEGVLSGPLIFRKDAEGNKTSPLLGFFVAGNYRNFLDSRPSIVGNYRLKEDVRESLLNDPMRFDSQGLNLDLQPGVVLGPNNEVIQNTSLPGANVQGFYNSEFITNEDIERVDARQNSRTQAATLTAKIDINTTPTIDLSFGSTFDWNNDNLYSYSGSLFNSPNNGVVNDYTIRSFGRFTQRFLNDNEQSGGIKNAYYSVMVDYTTRNQTAQDPLHEDRLFNYGYVGKFETTLLPNYIFDEDENAYYLQGYRETEIQFTPSEINSALAAVTTDLYNYYDANGFTVRNFEEIRSSNGLINGDTPQRIYNLYTNIGAPYDRYSYFTQDQFRISANGSADIGNHAISIGFEYEQYTERGFTAIPVGLWNAARLQANSHIQQFDSVVTSSDIIDGSFFYNYDRINDIENQSAFDRNLRIKLGLDPNGDDILFVDELDPDFLSLDMFSADELLNQGDNYVTYYGYDHTGEKTTGRPTFDDFFTERDENGNFTRPIGAFEPIYISGYIMDKFAFDDIIFNVGVRVDRFDANQYVLKDEYIVGDAYTVGEIPNTEEYANLQNHPGNIGEDFAVYVNDLNNPTAINGYRDGDIFYNAQGVQVEDPQVLRTAAGIAPFLKNTSTWGDSLNSNAFRDYTPQVNFMPRIAFSFPISDEAVFFAHYDILTQRPTVQNRLNPIDYLYIQSRNNAIANPNLQPTRTIDYELGFQQVLSRSSSLKISAFYRESRFEIQAKRLIEAFPRTYTTYANFDFGTTKGLTLAYDLRRTGNVTLRASYTLQFANATGSNEDSGLNLANSGEPQLRVIFPTDRDQRHLIITAFDYRYGEGKDYNGPVINGKQIFSNSGLNIVANLGSGSPYSRQHLSTSEGFIDGVGTPQLKGSINGSRLPWTFSVNAQLDKSWTINFGKAEGEKQKQAFLNVYLLANNLLNTANIITVYRYTGNADDDGYLEDPRNLSGIQDQTSEQSFRDLYALKVNSPFNYNTARTIQLGVKLDF